jgi:hypothetical protein
MSESAVKRLKVKDEHERSWYQNYLPIRPPSEIIIEEEIEESINSEE